MDLAGLLAVLICLIPFGLLYLWGVWLPERKRRKEARYFCENVAPFIPSHILAAILEEIRGRDMTKQVRVLRHLGGSGASVVEIMEREGMGEKEVRNAIDRLKKNVSIIKDGCGRFRLE